MATRKSGIFPSILGAGALAAMLLLAACGPRAGNKAGDQADNAMNEAAATVEDVSPDSLAAPENIQLDEESGDTTDGAQGNATANAP